MKNTDDEINTIQIARKYNLVPGTVKCCIFEYFENGYSPREVRYLMEKYLVKNTTKERRTMSNNIRRYYYDWEKAQKIDINKRATSI
jgi:hypothetical protein